MRAAAPRRSRSGTLETVPPAPPRFNSKSTREEPADRKRLEELVSAVEAARVEVGATLDPRRRAALGQYFTPWETAALMAAMFEPSGDVVRLLDPGAGAGALTAAWTAKICAASVRPARVEITAFEIDEALLPPLRRTLALCRDACVGAGIECTVELRNEDFIEAAVAALDHDLFRQERLSFNAAILNPPYRKIRSESRHRKLLSRVGIETSNLYAAFLALVVELLDRGGELVAITPRSFCNGPYFRPFRDKLLDQVDIRRLHLFESRTEAFRDDEVLQENIILHAVKGRRQGRELTLSQSRTPGDPVVVERRVLYERVVPPTGPERFIHLVTDEAGHELAERMSALPCSLPQLSLTVSTGRVVDFRARAWLRQAPEAGTVPLIYPCHMVDGRVSWPQLEGKKPNAIVREAESASLLIPVGFYVLVKRFSSKEERRRIVAAVFDPADVPCDEVGLENHLNYFHDHGRPLVAALAHGLAAFLNSPRVDAFFRQFNGHTQVNATDLRSLRYPTKAALVALGKRLEGERMSEEAVDAHLDLAATPELVR